MRLLLLSRGECSPDGRYLRSLLLSGPVHAGPVYAGRVPAAAPAGRLVRAPSCPATQSAVR